MVAQIHDSWLEQQIIKDRQQRHIDQRDEVWDGVYMIFPPNDIEHQEILTELLMTFVSALGWHESGDIYPGVNVSDCRDNWTHNYRCPDVTVFLNGTAAQNCSDFYYGGPDFCVEIVSPHDRAREKIPFYASVNTRELLVVDREPWALELFRLDDGKLVSVGVSTVENAVALPSEVVPLALKLIAGEPRPLIEITHNDGQQCWVV